MEKRIFILLFILLGSLHNYGQKAKVNLAHKNYGSRAYANAIEEYEEILDKGNLDREILINVGTSYYLNADYSNAAKWLGKLYETSKAEMQLVDLLRYSQSLMSSNRPAEAKEAYAVYLAATGKNPDDNKGKSPESSFEYTIGMPTFNESQIDYGAFMRSDTLYFSSNRTPGKSGDLDFWNNAAYLDIYTVKYNAGTNSFEDAVPLEGLEGPFHQSSPVITKNGKYMYYTATAQKAKTKKGKDHLRIYKATKVKGKWKQIEDLTINGDDFSTAHPVLNQEEDIMYFVSNRPNGYGQTDIYAANLNEDGTLGEPVNLGPQINTMGRETFPFINEDEILFYASDGLMGMGALDIYKVDLKDDEYQPINLGKDLNGPMDDYAYYESDKNGNGFFSSNRHGNDNLFTFTKRGKTPETEEEKDEEGERADVAASNNVNTNGSNENPNLPAFDSTSFDVRDFKNLYFDNNSSYLRLDDMKRLNVLAAHLKAHKTEKLLIDAHTDSQFTTEYNQWLSERRGSRVKEFLIAQGIDPNRIKSKAHGETKLIKCIGVDKCTDGEHQINRRVEIRLIQ